MSAISIHGRRVECAEWGQGPCLVLLHAGASSGRQWSRIAKLLEHRFHLVAPDFWGYGGTEAWSGDEALSHDHQAMLVARVVEHTCDGPVHLVGHSYGGATAVRLTLGGLAPVRSMVLIEPLLTTLLDHAGEDRLFGEYRDMVHGFLDNVAAGDPDEAWRIFLDYRNGVGTWQAMKESARERIRTVTQSAVAGFHSNLGNPTTLRDLAHLSLPVHVMCGEATTVPDRRVTEIVRDHVAGCRYTLIPGAEHMSPLTHPEFIARAIERHVDECDATG